MGGPETSIRPLAGSGGLTVLLPILGLVLGVTMLVAAADRSVGEAETISERFGVSPVVVGALVVGLGTSLPEMVVSGLAAAQRDTIDLAIGNFIGSNAANITLVLGTGAVITDVTARRSVYRREGGLVLASTALVSLFLLDGLLARWEAIALVMAMAGAAVMLAAGPTDERPTKTSSQPVAIARSIVTIVVGLAAVVVGAQLLVISAISIAERLGASEGFVGLTVVAIGTSLPELATTVAAARRRSVELIIGNIFGSNVFNSLAVAGVAGLVGTGRLSHTPTVSLGVMAGVTVLAVVAGALGRSFSRRDGLSLLAVYPLILFAA